MKASVIIPVYNEEQTINDCIKSLLSQSYKNLEIILVDDGSTDNTLSKLEKYKANKKIKILAQNHKGPAAARNKGAKNAKGQIFVFVDADMAFPKNFLKNLISPIIESGEKGTAHSKEIVKNWDNIWAKNWNFNKNLPSKNLLKNSSKDKVFRAILASEFKNAKGFDAGGYDDDYSLANKLGILPKKVHAKAYHSNPDTIGEVFTQAKWAAKRKYKLGSIGALLALVRAIIFTVPEGIYKAVKFKSPFFIIFKAVYNFAQILGIIEHKLLKNPLK